MIENILDKLVDEKMDCKEYMEWADKVDNEEVKKMFEFIASQERDHYKMLKEYISSYLAKEGTM